MISTGPPVHYGRDLLVQNTRGRGSSSGLFLTGALCWRKYAGAERRVLYAKESLVV